MNIFEQQYDICKKKYQRVKALNTFLRISTFNLFNLNKKISKLLSEINRLEVDISKYNELKNGEEILLDNVRSSKTSIYNIQVILPQDYGFEWEVIRKKILERDNHECQEKDGSCSGVLQVHHITPLSQGGSNSNDNLMTLCYFHHCQKHKHMR